MKNVALVLPVLLLSTGWMMAQTGDLTPADNLVTENIPKIPASLVEGVGRYTEFRAAGLADWHPTKREMLIATRFGDTAQVHHVKFPGGARTQLTFFPDSVGGARYQPKQASYFVFVKGSGGNERFQAYRHDFATGNVTLLTDGKSRNTGGVWSNGGDELVYSSTRRNGADNDLYLMDPADPKSDRLLLEVKGGGWQGMDWSPDDSKILLRRIRLRQRKLPLAARRRQWGQDAHHPQERFREDRLRGGEFSKDGKGLYVTTDKDSNSTAWRILTWPRRAHTFLTDQIKWNIEEFELSRDGKTIAFIANEDGVGTLHLLDTATGKEQPAPTVPAGSVLGVKWHNNSKDLGFVLVSARSPADVYSLDVETGKVDRWTESETGGLNTSSVRRAGVGPLEDLRRPHDLRLPLQAAGQVHRQAAGRHQHPRRPGGAVPPWLPGPEQLLPQ